MRDYSFGNFLYELRTRRGLTQYQLGALVGVSDKAVSKWENGSSKPQSSILYKLSEILGISVDELLSCKYHSFEKKDAKGVFAMKNQLWNKAFNAMCQRYGNPAPIEISNRFLTEQAEMQNTDMIVYLDLLSTLAEEAKKQGEHIRVKGGTGASFVSYLLGATEINPLKPHYFCPDCLTIIFDNSALDGWDLPNKQCSCGNIMVADGHNIPFETYRHVVHCSTSFDISVSAEFLNSAKSIILEYFRDCKMIIEERDLNRIITFTVTSEKSVCQITLCTDREFTRYKLLEQATATPFDSAQICCESVLKAFQKCNTDGIHEYETDFMKNMLSTIRLSSFHDLIQTAGMSHGTCVWIGNGEKLIEQGYSVSNLIAYRDDAFNYTREKMIAKGLVDTGFAYRVMNDARRGIYAQKGIPDYIRSHLKAVGIEEWFIDSIGKIRYLFPKAHGVTYIKLAATLM